MPLQPSDYDPQSPVVKENPYPYYAVLREQSPLHWVESFQSYFVSRYDDVAFVLKNPALFSSANKMLGGKQLAAIIQGRGAPVNALITTDPPVHTRLRNLVNRAFTARRVADLEPRIRELARGLVAEVVARQEFECVEGLTGPLPVIVIAELLGVEPSRRRDFKRWSDLVVTATDTYLRGEDMAPIQQAQRELYEYLGGIIAQRRAAPRDDLLSVLIEASEPDGALTEDELLIFARLLLVAGNETTTHLLGNALNLLVRHPDPLAWLVENPSGIPAAIEEVLRYDPPVQGLTRRATQRVELAGGTVPEGAMVRPLLASAQRDPRRFPDPDRFDVRREPQGQLAFGHGTHFCLGAPLARLEAKVALEELLAQAPRLRFASRQPEPVEWMPSAMLRGPKSLWLRGD